MEYVVLGRTGLKISRVGFGGIPIQRIDAEAAKDLMRTVHESGINYIDTARGYTVSEEFIGGAIEGFRKDFILATKSMSRDKAGMAKDVDISLKNLRTDYIDLYQVHNIGNADQLAQVVAPGGALEALQEAKAAGKIGHIGLTTHSASVFEMALELDWVETIMFPYNIVETQGEQLIDKCAEKNIGFIVMKPLAGGAIEDGEIAMRFLAANPNATCLIPGMYCAEEVKKNVAAASNTAPLTEAELEKVAQIRKELGTNFCRRCNYCQPCTAGIAIANMFLFHGYLSRYGLADWARERYSTQAITASACVDCGECEPRCPYNLPIRDMLKKVAADFGR